MLLPEALGRTLHGTAEEETLYVSGDNLTQILGVVKRSNLKKGGGRKKICRQESWKSELKR